MSHPQFAHANKPIVIGDYAWLGIRANILGGVTIGEGAVVLARVMVTHDITPYAVVGGVPVKVIRQRELQQPVYSLDYHPLLE